MASPDKQRPTTTADAIEQARAEFAKALTPILEKCVGVHRPARSSLAAPPALAGA
jgi:hypothetical protein